MLGGEHPARATEAGRDLVEDQQGSVAAAKILDAAHEGRFQHERAEIADHRLEDHRGNVARLQRGFDLRQPSLVERRLDRPRRRQAKTGKQAPRLALADAAGAKRVALIAVLIVTKRARPVCSIAAWSAISTASLPPGGTEAAL